MVCTPILDESLEVFGLSLSGVTSPSCTSAVPALLLPLSSDLMLLSFLFLSPFLLQALLLGFFIGLL